MLYIAWPKVWLVQEIHPLWHRVLHELDNQHYVLNKTMTIMKQDLANLLFG